jgi:peptide-methionine (R)-S-oxide reductase
MNQQNPNLSEEQKQVLFNKGTETPGTGKFLNHNEAGMYTCAKCGAELFKSDAKY